MAKPPPLRAPSAQPPLDQALEAVASGDSVAALRWAVPLVKADLAAPVPLYVLGGQLLARGQAEAGRVALEVAADRAADGGNLPVAIAALAALREAKTGIEQRAAEIAKAYAKGSPRLRQGATLPPLAPPDVTAIPGTLAEAQLLAQASEVVEYASAALDADRAKRPSPPFVPPQSLFSSFSEGALRALALAFEVRLVARGGKVIEQGAEGAEAFVLARGELEVLRETPDGEPLLLARLGNGAVFGEMALLSRAPRAASVVAVKPSLVLLVSVARLEEVAGTSPEVGTAFASYCQRRMVANLVRTSPLLGPLSAGERQALIERFTTRSFERGSRLILQGKESDGLHVVASGELGVVRHDGADEVTIARLGVGEVVGEVSLVFRRVSNADVVAEQPTLTLFLPRARFMEIVREHPTLLSQLYTLAAFRDDETASIVAQEAAEADDLII